MLYICVKFHQNIWNGFQLIEWTWVHSRNGYFQYLLCSKDHNSKSRLTRVMVFMFYTLSHSTSHLWDVSLKYLEQFSTYSGHKYTVEMAMFNVQRSMAPKVCKPELRFMCSACRLIVLYICVKFRENISNGFQFTERTWVHGRNGYVQCSKGNNFKTKQTRSCVLHIIS